MQRLTTRSRATAEAIMNREDFRTSGALSGESEPTYSSAGYLRGADLERFLNDRPWIRYIVRSYDTPIAWWCPERGWYKVRAKFSPTTSKHQGNLYLIEETPDVRGCSCGMADHGAPGHDGHGG